MMGETVQDVAEDELAMERVASLIRVPCTSLGISAAVWYHHVPEIMQRILLITGKETMVLLNCLLCVRRTKTIVHLSVMVPVTPVKTRLVRATQISSIEMDMDLAYFGKVSIMIVSSFCAIIAHSTRVCVAGQLKQLQRHRGHCGHQGEDTEDMCGSHAQH